MTSWRSSIWLFLEGSPRKAVATSTITQARQRFGSAPLRWLFAGAASTATRTPVTEATAPTKTLLPSPQHGGVVPRQRGPLVEPGPHRAPKRHLLRLVRDYLLFYNDDRPHMALDGNTPAGRAIEGSDGGDVVELPRVGGLHHRYARAA